MQNELPMRIVGGKVPPSVWERFNRLQRTAEKLVGQRRYPRGVFCFKTHEEADEWTMNYQIRKGNPPAQTSSPSAGN